VYVVVVLSESTIMVNRRRSMIQSVNLFSRYEYTISPATRFRVWEEDVRRVPVKLGPSTQKSTTVCRQQTS
jgi:hypothetical protein